MLPRTSSLVVCVLLLKTENETVVCIMASAGEGRGAVPESGPGSALFFSPTCVCVIAALLSCCVVGDLLTVASCPLTVSDERRQVTVLLWCRGGGV